MAHRSTALPLACFAALLVVYASLYPFEGWRWPPGVDGLGVLELPWPQWRDRFDDWANGLGYMPLGALIYGAVVRGGGPMRRAFMLALVLPALLSYAVELAQQFVPGRVPSAKDFSLNVLGAAAGALVAAALQSTGVVDRWQALRERWFAADSALALLLLLLWPVALLFPAPVPLGIGHVWGEFVAALRALLADTPWESAAAAWLEGQGRPTTPLSRLQEGAIVVLGLLAPCLVAYATTYAGWHRLWLLLGALALGVGVTTLSTALNFGPAHALAWWSPTVFPALTVGAALALAALGLGRRLASALGFTALTLLVTLVAQAPSDPYYAASLQGWEQGRFIRFHGLAQWVGWLWPFAAMAWLLARMARRSGD
jgi:VanZ family protein